MRLFVDAAPLLVISLFLEAHAARPDDSDTSLPELSPIEVFSHVAGSAGKTVSSCMQVLHRILEPEQETMATWDARKAEMRQLGKFWVIFIGVFGLIYLAVQFLSGTGRPDGFTRPLKVAAIRLHNEPAKSQLGGTFVLFSIADILAQRSPEYFTRTHEGHAWDWRWTLTVTGSAMLFQVVFINVLYDRLDKRFGSPTTLPAILLKTLQMQLVFAFFYLPVAVLLYAILSGHVFRTLEDGFDNCGTSAIKAQPQHFGGSVVLSLSLWQGDYLQSLFFWPPSHLVNYIMIHRWSAEFRPIFDGVVILFWNLFAKVAGSSAREAVGPVLFGAAPGPTDKVEESLDCSNYSFTAIFRWLWQKFVDTCVWIWETLIFALRWVWSRTVALVVALSGFLAWCLLGVCWAVGFALLWILTAGRVALYYTFALVKGAIKALFWALDWIKWCFVVLDWFLPKLYPLAEGCFYCSLWPEKWPLQIIAEPPEFGSWVKYESERY